MYNYLMDFSRNAFYQEKLSKLSLEKEIIRAKDFEECDFDSCIFVDCIFEKCKFIGCNFNECILSAINPLDSRFIDITFTKSKVIGFDWTRAQKIEDLAFNNCQINYSNFKLLKIPGVKITGCEAKEVDFIETDLSKGDFKNTDFEKSRFFKTNLTGADFKGAKNYFIDVKNNALKKTRFSLPEALVLLDSLDIIIE
ncbi:MAG: pentapeptide repeat-containing protein [Dehalococcoidales bacterium]|nr:pentapeptide repeat-containing protein [Dehalococcoidales bacterium]